MRPLPGLFRFSTALFLCHLLAALFAADVRAQSIVPPSPADQLAPDTVRITADRQEKFGHIFHLRGSVEILFRDMRLTADEVDYDETTRDVDARGNVRFERAANHEDLRARDAHYNLLTELGQFYQVSGTTGARPTTGQVVMLTTTNPYYIEARRVDKVGDNTYMVYDGFLTSCRPSNMVWTFSAPRARVKPGENAKIYNSFVRLFHRVPIFFSPFLYHSLERIPRSSGFLTPNIGNSSQKGRVLGESFFWAINRSADAEGGLEYYSERGWAQRGTFRMRPNATTTMSASYFGVVDRGERQQDGSRIKKGGRTLVANFASDLPRGFRAVADISYLSSFIFRAAFTETYLEAINTEVRSNAFVSNNFNSYSLNGRAFRIQNFQSFTDRVGGDAIDLRSMPAFEFNSYDQPLRRLPLYFSFDTAAEGHVRVEPRFQSPEIAAAPQVKTPLVSRFDLFPRLTAPVHWKGLDLTATWGVRATHYGSRFRDGVVSGEDFRRTSAEFGLDLRPPSLARIYESPARWLGTRLKHTIEPRAGFRWVEGVNRFADIIRFDERDILADTREVEYGLANRIYRKRADGAVGELFSWELAQRYYFDPAFGGALVPGQRNVFTSALSLSGYSFLDGERRFSPVTSLVRFRPAWNLGMEWRADYDPLRRGIAVSGFTVDTRKGNAFLSISDYVVRSSPLLRVDSHQLRGMIGYGSPNRLGFNVGGVFAYDLRQELVPYFSVQANYNFDCCGFSFEFRRFHFGPTLRDDRQFRVAITFANIGSFGTLKKQERMF